MNILPRRQSILGLAFLAIALMIAPARAVAPLDKEAGLDKYLPADTEILISVNLKHIFTSAITKKLGIDKLKDSLKEVNADVILKELAFDPFTDLDRIISTGPGTGESDKGLIIVYGKFDLAKFKAKADEAVKDHPDVLKASKVGDTAVYELVIPGQDSTLFIAFVNGTTMLASPVKDYLAEAMKKADSKEKPALKNKEFQTLLESIDDKQTVAMAAMGSALVKSELKDTPAKDYLEKITTIKGVLNLATDIKLDLQVGTKTDGEAKEISEILTKGIDQGLSFAGLLISVEKKLEIAVDLLKSVKLSTEGKKVVAKGGLSAEQVEKILKKDL